MDARIAVNLSLNSAGRGRSRRSLQPEHEVGKFLFVQQRLEDIVHGVVGPIRQKQVCLDLAAREIGGERVQGRDARKRHAVLPDLLDFMSDCRDQARDKGIGTVAVEITEEQQIRGRTGCRVLPARLDRRGCR